MRLPLIACRFVLSLHLLLAAGACAAVHYVDINSAAPTAPYSTWATAARTIQDAIDAAFADDEVIVTNGIYAVGGRVVDGAITNRVAVTKALTIRSVNGPQFTTIHGSQVPGTTNGDGAVRCVYLTHYAVLSGFTLTNGATRTVHDDLVESAGGGLWCLSTNAVATNCVLAGNSAHYLGGGTLNGTLRNCLLSNNAARIGGGAAFRGLLIDCTVAGNAGGGGGGADQSRLFRCLLAGNRANSTGGGADYSTLVDCVLSNNTAAVGGGVWFSTLTNCMLVSNSASDGGAADYSTLADCTLTGNRASYFGGGAHQSTLFRCRLEANSASYGGGAREGKLYNCTLRDNTATNTGGGALSAALTNCTLTGNAAALGGGAGFSVLQNCIVYFNAAPNGSNWYGGEVNYCCTAPVLMGSGFGNFNLEPRFIDRASGDLRLQSNSPCINAGLNSSVPAGPDLDGAARIAGPTVDVGAYEFQSPRSVLPYAWLEQHGLLTDGSADFTDTDGDGLNNAEECRCGTVPTDAASVLQMLASEPRAFGMLLRWQSAWGRRYNLELCTNLALPPTQRFQVFATNIFGQDETTSYGDTAPQATKVRLYRVVVP